MTTTTVAVARSSRSVLLTVSDVIAETADAHSLEFEVPADGFAYHPGQFLTVRIPSTRTGSVARCYSLASSPHTDDRPKVTVKRTPAGYGSNWLCDNVAPGHQLEVLPPAGVFTPKDLDTDLLLFAGGSGITPVVSIVKSALAAGSGNVVLVYANRDPDAVIFADELRALAAGHDARFTLIHWLETLQGRPTARRLATIAAPYRAHHAYLCGPAPFLAVVRDALTSLGFPRDRVHAEVFTSLRGDPFDQGAEAEAPPAGATDTTEVEVDLDGRTHVVPWPRTHTLVDAMLTAGIDVPYSCREGECGSCACTVVDGQVEMGNSGILDPDDIAGGYILGCQARPLTERLKIRF